MSRIPAITKTLTSPASGDLVHVVDVSDTSEHATGSSAKATLGQLGVLVPTAEETGSPPDFTSTRCQLHPVDLANGVTGLSDNGEVTFPSTPSAGDLFGFFVAKPNVVDAGSSPFSLAPYYCVEPASGVGINGATYTAKGAGGGNAYSLWLAGERLVFRYHDSTLGWVVEQDGRIQHKCHLYLSSAASGEGTASFGKPTDRSGAWSIDHDIGGLSQVAEDTIWIKRANVYMGAGYGKNTSDLGEGKYFGVRVLGTTATEFVNAGKYGTSSSADNQSHAGMLNCIDCVAGDDFEFQYRSEEGSKGLSASGEDGSYFFLSEQR